MLSTIERAIKQELRRHFDLSVDIDKRVRVISDLYKFNYKEDLYVWGQKRGHVSKHYSVYFDDEFVCGFDDKESKDKFILDFFKGIKRLVTEDKIIVNKHLADQAKLDDDVIKKDKKKKEKKRIDSLPDQTPTEKLAKEAVKRVSRKKKSHPSLIASRPNS